MSEVFESPSSRSLVVPGPEHNVLGVLRAPIERALAESSAPIFEFRVREIIAQAKTPSLYVHAAIPVLSKVLVLLEEAAVSEHGKSLDLYDRAAEEVVDLMSIAHDWDEHAHKLAVHCRLFRTDDATQAAANRLRGRASSLADQTEDFMDAVIFLANDYYDHGPLRCGYAGDSIGVIRIGRGLLAFMQDRSIDS